jgi:hypothetical protein
MSFLFVASWRFHVSLSNALPFSGLGAAKPAPQSYADASAATRSAATACSAATVGHAS